MAGMSVSWRHAARALATAAAAILALALLPSLLRTPDPPPLDPDVGLTGVASAHAMGGGGRESGGGETWRREGSEGGESEGRKRAERREPQRHERRGRESGCEAGAGTEEPRR